MIIPGTPPFRPDFSACFQALREASENDCENFQHPHTEVLLRVKVVLSRDRSAFQIFNLTVTTVKHEDQINSGTFEHVRCMFAVHVTHNDHPKRNILLVTF